MPIRVPMSIIIYYCFFTWHTKDLVSDCHMSLKLSIKVCFNGVLGNPSIYFANSLYLLNLKIIVY